MYKPIMLLHIITDKINTSANHTPNRNSTEQRTYYNSNLKLFTSHIKNINNYDKRLDCECHKDRGGNAVNKKKAHREKKNVVHALFRLHQLRTVNPYMDT